MSCQWTKLTEKGAKTMSINNISSQSTYATGLQQKQQNMNNLFSALKAGDLASAQKAYAASGLPAMAMGNTSPLGRLYHALRSEDLASAQKAALEMQPKHNGQGASTTAQTSGGAVSTKNVTAAQKAATALANANIAAQQSSVFALMGIGNNVNTSA
jgi:hypothetical protein